MTILAHMKNHLFLVFILLLISCKTNSKDKPLTHFYIIGQIDTDKTSTAYLKLQENNKTIILDSTLLKNRKFEFKGEIKTPTVYGIYIKGIKGRIGLFMDSDTITIKALKNNLGAATITGSKTHNEYLNFTNKSKRITSQINLLFPEFQKARAENNAEELNAINKRMQVINNENTQFTLSYAKQNPDSYISAYALYSVLRISSIQKDTISKFILIFLIMLKRETTQNKLKNS